jgi:hypothetical protein
MAKRDPALEAFWDWYFREDDRRPVHDQDEHWQVVWHIGQIYGVGLNGGIAASYAGSGRNRERDVRENMAHMRAVGLDQFAAAMETFATRGDPDPFDDIFFRDPEVVARACRAYAQHHGLYPGP